MGIALTEHARPSPRMGRGVGGEGLPRRRAMPNIDLGDVTIHYEEAGSGPAYIFCHGLGGNGASFVEEFPFYSQYFRVVTWDNRGLGRSSGAAKYNVPL